MAAGIEALREGVLRGDRVALARALSLIESVRDEDRRARLAMLRGLQPPQKPIYRVGFTGAPGAGKSTLIDSLGAYLLEQYPTARLAVLTVDPSSWRSGGSLLADQTRMRHLASHPRAFIRTFASGGHLGGLHPRIYEAITLCEAAGFDWLFIESVGTGQSEVELRYACDFLLYVALPYAGDEVQGIKRGLMEALDGIALNKADTVPPDALRRAQFQLETALHFLRGHETPFPFVLPVSALTASGLPELWEKIFAAFSLESLEPQRQAQLRYWITKYWEEALHAWLERSPYGITYASIQARADTTPLWQLVEEIYAVFGLIS
ncbi:MAG: methylmalonyl Co-A mutase-associated GTPase MeaB [Bacteroidia bacterium]|nr:methylmalonyl Co-A mutase-associated GTPase MeaB [Bacteroidia bacterium]GIV24114.1 MAG: ATPase/protein kinase [Bacteroidia bacterium]